MKEFMDELARVRSAASAHAAELGKKHNLQATKQPIGALGMWFNFLTAALEQTSHYQVAWGKEPIEGLAPEQIARKRAENGQRLVMLSKTAFVWCLSSIEYAMKAAMERYPDVMGEPGKRRYLRDVINMSADIGLISDGRRRLWLGANAVRNRLVHNNGIGNRDAEWNFSEKLTVTMNDGEMIEGTIMTFPYLIGWLLDAYAEWCDAFLERAE